MWWAIYISEEETEEEIPGGGIREPAETRCVSSKTKCWLFFEITN